MPARPERRLERIRDALPDGWSEERLLLAEARLFARLGDSRGRSRWRFAFGVSALAMAAAVAVIVMGPPRTPPTTGLGVLRFADGSTAEILEPGTVIERADGEGGGAELVSGRARFRASKERRFHVKSGAVRVVVLGTDFFIERAPGAAGTVRVRVEAGRARVMWPAGEVELGAGQDGWFPPLSTSAPAPTEAAPVVAPAPPPAPTPVRVEPRTDWRRLARAGEFARAYDAMRSNRRTSEDARDLLLAAEVARKSGHPREATAPLERVLARHPESALAPIAGFTLGQVLADDLGRHGDAARAFERAAALGQGDLVDNALVRAIEARIKAGQPGEARRLAELHRARFPGSPHRAIVRRLLGTP